MSGWGPWHDVGDDDVHVVPCDEQRNVLGGHVRSIDCFCKPQRRDYDAHVIVHNDRERGGLDG